MYVYIYYKRKCHEISFIGYYVYYITLIQFLCIWNEIPENVSISLILTRSTQEYRGKLSPEITLNNAYIAQLTYTTRPQIIQGCIHKIWTTEIGSKMHHCCIHTELANWPGQVLFYHSPKLQLLCWTPNGKTQFSRASKNTLNLFSWRCKACLLSLLV